MKLVTFGCSWLYGDELLPDTPEYRNSVNLGGVIKQAYNFGTYINYANNSASNERIIHQIIEYKNSKYYDENDFILIGLSGLSRQLEYINYFQFPMTIPGWERMHIKHWNNGKEFEDWFDLKGKFTINTRNELLRYGINILTIKSLINNHKYLVFQSIDNIFKLYQDIIDDKTEWMDVPIDYAVNGNQDRCEGVSLFKLDEMKKEITSNLNDSQKWLNFEIPSWFDILKEKGDLDMFANNYTTNHPSELGAKFYFNTFLKTHLDKIL